MTNPFRQHFTYRRLWQFAVPSIAMMIIESIYSIVDGFFVSNYAGKAAFAAVNLMIPLLLIPATTGLIFGTGGAALVGQCLGEGQRDKANRLFSLFTVVTLSTGTVLTLAGAFWLEDVLRFLGANGDLLRDCRQYARIILFSLPCYTLQIFFHSFFATSGKPSVGLAVSMAAGCLNTGLDAILVISLPLEYKYPAPPWRQPSPKQSAVSTPCIIFFAATTACSGSPAPPGPAGPSSRPWPMDRRNSWAVSP